MIKKLIKIADVDVLCRSNCKIKDPERVERMLSELVAGGPRCLQVVSDFDYTITKQRTDTGIPVESSFNMFYQCRSLPASCRLDSVRLTAKYRPIEIDPTVPAAIKLHAMIEWWKASSALLTGFPLGRDEIQHVVAKYQHCLRDGTLELFVDLNELNVPLLVFSAGLGDTVMAVLQQAGCMLPNVKIISNFLRYGSDGILNGFDTDNMIHTMNKNETALHGAEMVADRTNVIVMGDSLGDADMACGCADASNVLKIGFLLEHMEANLPKYMDTFDIVLLDDQTMDVARAIVKLMQ